MIGISATTAISMFLTSFQLNAISKEIATST